MELCRAHDLKGEFSFDPSSMEFVEANLEVIYILVMRVMEERAIM